MIDRGRRPVHPRDDRAKRSHGAVVATFVAAIVLLAGPVGLTAAAGDAPVRIPDQSVYDLAAVFDTDAERSAENLASTLRTVADADIVVVSETALAGLSADGALARATVLRTAMGVGDGSGGGGVLVYVGVESSDCAGRVAMSASDDFEDVVPAQARQAIVDDDMAPLVAACDLDSALLVGLSRLATAALASSSGSTPGSDGATVTAGPPFPDPVADVAVYDTAGIFQPATIAATEKTIDGVESRTGAEVAVYTQVVESGRTTEEADADARALLDQWGVGRKGFDDGLVILFDMYPGLEHGQVILYGGPGYRAKFLDNGEKQRIFDEDMLPRLSAGDFDGALLIAMQRVDAAATPEHAESLQRARQIDAVAGLVVAPMLALLLIGGAAWSWLRYGRDPVYLDDPSIHMAGPPETLTPAGAVFVLSGGPSRRALTTALLDLASRGGIAFRQESHLLGLKKTVGIETEPAGPDPETRARQLRNAARPLGPAEEVVERRLRALAVGPDGYIEPDELLGFGAAVPVFDTALENEVVARGWFREKPSAAVARWTRRAVLAGVAGALAIIGGINVPSNGLLLIGVALVGAAVGVAIVARRMPAVSLPGAMIRATLAAYRRTLKKTMDQARSMDQVVAEAGLPWLETPDQAVVWGTALGLHDEIETVLGRAFDDLRDGRASPGAVWLPTWYGTGSGGGSAATGDFAGAGAGSGGLFSSSAMPDFGGMMSALGSIGNSPSSSSGGGSGGGFGGGGSGGGGGGSGGGF
jgi:uncharacterized membrane protein YgcG